jgi:galactose mutarotase-like enzyme
MATIENDILRVSISTKGAQLTSVYDKVNQLEHLWQADPAVWPWHAPNLFPIVGQLINNELLVDGKSYPMNRHGFARQSEFILLQEEDDQVTLSLPSSDQTAGVYPYKFDFQVLYTLIDNALRVTYKLINHDDKPVWFSVGGHPAFRVPFFPGEKYEDYYLEFEMPERLVTHMISAEGLFNGETQYISSPGNKLHLSHELFAKDALVFKDLVSREVSIKSDKHDKSVSVQFPHFNYLGLWSKGGGEFVCIEPWLGCADTAGRHVDISQKEDIQVLKPGHVFEAAFFISL